MRYITNLLLFICCIFFSVSNAQNVPIESYGVNPLGQVQLEIDAEADKYYILTTLHEPELTFQSITSMTKGVDGPMIITEALKAYSQQSYRITAHSIADPDDTDGDGIDDVSELDDMPTLAPLNYAAEIPFVDGTTSIDSRETFSELAVIDSNIPWAPFLNNQEFAKFVILNQNSDKPEIYFINSKTHYIHADFLGTIDTQGDDLVSGEIVYNPNQILANGAIGSYSFNYSFGFAENFEHTRQTFELLAANMPFLENNFQHFIGSGGEATHINSFKDHFIGSRINVVLESELFADVDFLPFNPAEGYGFFRVMTLEDNPGSRDIVLYDALPNSLPRVGGIITSVVQTPLSHVNLRAIQDNLPNAYIKDPLMIDSIANLVGKYIYYKVETDGYTIREASLEEVNAWYENIRPTEDQIPPRDLSMQDILPLDEIEFEMASSFGAKCSNVATMRDFGFPEGTIPNGFGIPFYYYDEFMKFNNFYDKVDDMITDPMFISDPETRIDMLSDFRKEIRAADMPGWMLDSLQVLHDAFPEGTSVRCRSSTNNEDLPGFSGAGLYTSKTQHPDEGHISKSVKQVYASMWNFRAFDERDFYRVDHFIAAMGVLCHPNYQDEKSNGVGVSIDPIYQTENTFYLNTQVGEFLITNPDANSIPEEILLSQDPHEGYFVLRNSNLVPDGELVMGEEYLNQMRDYLQVIHDEFAILYDVVGAEGFGMDIEYKVTKDDQLIIKQARPWVSFWSGIKANADLGVEGVINPATSSALSGEEVITTTISNSGLLPLHDFEMHLIIDEEIIETKLITEELSPQRSENYDFETMLDMSEIKEYIFDIVVDHPSDGYASNDTLSVTVMKLHYLEAGLEVGEVTASCGNEVDVDVRVTNYGEETFTETKIEVVANGIVVDTFIYNFNIPYLASIPMVIKVSENLQLEDNEILFNIVSVNGQPDAISDNNSGAVTASLESDFDFITLVINADDYPQETSWEVFDVENNELIAGGSLPSGANQYKEDICVNYTSCVRLFVYDSVGDGICCGFGVGDFLVLDSSGETLITNGGDFGFEAEELICLSPEECDLSATFTLTDATSAVATDGKISIAASGGLPPYTYSINGGAGFVSNSEFDNVLAGEYDIVIRDVTEECIYEETILVEINIIDSAEDYLNTGTILYPNPTADRLVIKVDNTFAIEGYVNIYIYNSLGYLMHMHKIQPTTETKSLVLSLDDYPSGSYIVKCHSSEKEKYFKVVKL